MILVRIVTWANAATTELYPHERGIWVLLAAAVLHYVPRHWLAGLGLWLQERSAFTQGALAATGLGVLGIVAAVNHPFIYFQF
jgi:hypothetical protein